MGGDLEFSSDRTINDGGGGGGGGGGIAAAAASTARGAVGTFFGLSSKLWDFDREAAEAALVFSASRSAFGAFGGRISSTDDALGGLGGRAELGTVEGSTGESVAGFGSASAVGTGASATTAGTGGDRD